METNMILIPALFGLFCFIVPAILWGFFLLLSVLRSSRAVGKIIGYESGSSDGDVAAPDVRATQVGGAQELNVVLLRCHGQGRAVERGRGCRGQ